MNGANFVFAVRLGYLPSVTSKSGRAFLGMFPDHSQAGAFITKFKKQPWKKAKIEMATPQHLLQAILISTELYGPIGDATPNLKSLSNSELVTLATNHVCRYTAVAHEKDNTEIMSALSAALNNISIHDLPLPHGPHPNASTLSTDPTMALALQDPVTESGSSHKRRSSVSTHNLRALKRVKGDAEDFSDSITQVLSKAIKLLAVKRFLYQWCSSSRGSVI
jgi:hypothetical protein